MSNQNSDWSTYLWILTLAIALWAIVPVLQARAQPEGFPDFDNIPPIVDAGDGWVVYADSLDNVYVARLNVEGDPAAMWTVFQGEYWGRMGRSSPWYQVPDSVVQDVRNIILSDSAAVDVTEMYWLFDDPTMPMPWHPDPWGQ